MKRFKLLLVLLFAGTGKFREGASNPFGVMLPSQLVRSPGGFQVAKTLGAVYYRPAGDHQ
ncbi:MAG: hypothetical protein ACUVRY_00300 [Thermoanaerobaculaceae bacterium]